MVKHVVVLMLEASAVFETEHQLMRTQFIPVTRTSSMSPEEVRRQRRLAVEKWVAQHMGELSAELQHLFWAVGVPVPDEASERKQRREAQDAAKAVIGTPLPLPVGAWQEALGPTMLKLPEIEQEEVKLAQHAKRRRG